VCATIPFIRFLRPHHMWANSQLAAPELIAFAARLFTAQLSPAAWPLCCPPKHDSLSSNKRPDGRRCTADKAPQGGCDEARGCRGDRRRHRLHGRIGGTPVTRLSG
jgi:hypothetical protein